MQPAFRLPNNVKWAVERLAGAGSSPPRPQPDPGLRDELSASVADDVACLRELTGKPFAGWSL
jgi:hypothetical protein